MKKTLIAFAVIGLLLTAGSVLANCKTDSDCIQPPICYPAIDQLGMSEICTTTLMQCVKHTCVFAMDCHEKWWYDNENRKCSKKEFCGAYAYESLRTFDSRKECKISLRHSF